jgi:hypothetical protein
MKPIGHEKEGAFLLAQVSGQLLRTSSCGAVIEKKPASSGARAGVGFATAFRLVQPDGDENAVITLYWKKPQGEWRVSSYQAAID